MSLIRNTGFLAGVLVTGLIAARAPAQPASLTVIHGIPGLPAPVEVYAGETRLFAFDFGETRGPLALPAGTYDLSVRLQGSTALSASATLAAGTSNSAVAHLQVGGGTALGLFENPTAGLAAANGRIIVRHLADAPAVDLQVRPGTTPLFATVGAGLSSGQGASFDLGSATYEARLTAAGTGNAVLGPLPLAVLPGQVTALHAVGTFGTPSFQLVAQPVRPGAPADLRAQTSGVGCGGAISSSTTAPQLGSTFSVRLSGAASQAPAVLLIGDDDAFLGGTPLPLDLASLGAPGCSLYTNIAADVTTATDAQGAAGVPVFLDPFLAPSFQGAFFQYAILDPAANALGVVASDLLSVTPAPAPDLELRVVHASPDAPPVDLYVQGQSAPFAGGLAYGEATGFLGLGAGTIVVDVRAAGSAPTSSPVFTSGPLTLAAGQRLTVVAAGLVGSSDPADRFRLLPFDDGFGAPVAGSGAVRVIHASPDASTVDIDVGDDGTSEITGLQRFGATGAAGVPLPAGAPLQVGILAGMPAARVTAFTAFLPEEPVYVIATGLLGSRPQDEDGFALLPVTGSGTLGLVRQNPVVHAFHSSPDTGPVDVSSGGAALAQNLAYGQISGPIQVPPGAHTLDIAPAGSGVPVASPTTPVLAAGREYLAVATGFTQVTPGQPFQLLAFEADFPVDPASARVRAVHNAPDVPTIDVGVVAGGALLQPALFPSVAFGGAAPELPVAPATLTIGLAAPGSTSPLVAFDVPFSAGLQGFALVSGSAIGSPGTQPLSLLVVVTSTSPWSVLEITPNP